jgi:PAS domain S-box-containing protein
METSNLLDHFVEEDLYRLILESLDEGVYIVDTRRRITHWNEGAERITGHLAQNVIGRNCNDSLLAHCGDNSCSYCAAGCPLSETMADGKARRMNAFLKHRLGHRVPVSIRSAPVHNAAGKIIGAVEIFHLNAQHFGLAQRFRGLEPFGCLDPDTGVANYEMTRIRLGHRLEDLRTFGIPLGVALIRLADQKPIVSRHGQEAWLSLLRSVAQTLAQTLPPNGFVGRWHEAGFLALLGNCDPIMLQETSARITSLMPVSDIVWWGHPLKPNASVRTTMGEPEDTPQSLAARLAC